MLTLGQKLTAVSLVMVLVVAVVLVGGLFFVFPAAIAALPFTVWIAGE